jgi:hypothetical protein
MPLSHKHIGSNISAKIKIYILTRAELLITLCNEIPCKQGLVTSRSFCVNIFNVPSKRIHMSVYSRVRNKHTPTLINFLTFFQGLWPYSGLHRAYFSSISIRYKWGYAYSFRQIFQPLCLFKGLRLFQTLE